jgi:hypothetical protein
MRVPNTFASIRNAATSTPRSASIRSGPVSGRDQNGFREAARWEFLDAHGNLVMSNVLRSIVPERGRALMRNMR